MPTTTAPTAAPLHAKDRRAARFLDVDVIWPNAGLATEKIRAVLRNGLNVAVKWRLLTWNPAELVDLPRRVARKPRFLAVDEAERLLVTVRGDRLEALYILALSLGLREGELLGLRWSDIDLAAGELRITNQLQNGQLVDVKSAASNRWVPLPEFARNALINHRERERLTSLDRLVFRSTVGTPIGAWNLLRAFKALLRRAGLPDNEIRFHDLRHSAATFLIARGSDPKTVQAILGHTTVRLTMDTYVHAIPRARIQKTALACTKLALPGFGKAKVAGSTPAVGSNSRITSRQMSDAVQSV